MHHYKNITCWENKRRAERLTEFRDAVVTYFNNSEYRWQSETRNGGEKAKEARQKINLMLNEICEIVHAAGVASKLQWRSGHIIDILSNLFTLEPPVTLEHRLDLIDRAIGVYKTNHRKSVIRTFNPFWWLGRALTWFAGLPFKLVASAGFNAARAENSLPGRFVKAVLLTIPAIASALTILYYLDLLDLVKQILGFVMLILLRTL